MTETVKHKHFPNRKFCKAHKGPHVQVLRKIKYFKWGKDRYWFDYTCDCGKKYYEFKSPENFTEEQAKMYEDYKKLRPDGQEIQQ